MSEIGLTICLRECGYYQLSRSKCCVVYTFRPMGNNPPIPWSTFCLTIASNIRRQESLSLQIVYESWPLDLFHTFHGCIGVSFGCLITRLNELQAPPLPPPPPARAAILGKNLTTEEVLLFAYRSSVHPGLLHSVENNVNCRCARSRNAAVTVFLTLTLVCQGGRLGCGHRRPFSSIPHQTSKGSSVRYPFFAVERTNGFISASE